MSKDTFTKMTFSEMFELVEEVNRYFKEETQKVYVDRGYIKTFEEYLNRRYRGNCYYYSAYALMGLKSDDFLVRGNIDINECGRCNYHHGWVEFNYKGNDYIFDSLMKGIVTKQAWYDVFKPEIDYKKTQKEILDEFLNEKCAFEVYNNFWQFKYYVMNTDKSQDEIDYDEMIEYDKKNSYVPSALKLARLNMYNSKITKFIAYNE